MTKNPFLNALAAFAYIVAVVLGMTYVTTHAVAQKSVIIPVAVLSLFTLSAAVMGYIFLAQPLRLYLDGDKQLAVKLFAQTVGIFAVLTVIVFGVLVSGIIH